MTTLVPRPQKPTVVQLRAEWACVCGRTRELVAAGVRTDRALDAEGESGPCRRCGHAGDRYRIDTTATAYRIRIERG